MSSELQAALIGALIGGGFAFIGALLAHFLSLREDRIKRERNEVEELRRRLLAGTDQISTNSGALKEQGSLSLSPILNETIRPIERNRLEDLQVQLREYEKLSKQLQEQHDQLQENWSEIEKELAEEVTNEDVGQPE